MLLLVALRVAIGWHFFMEGVSHRHDPKWSSEPFLRQAKGPLAEKYKAKLPDFHGWETKLATPLIDADENESVAAEAVPAKPPASGKAVDNLIYGDWYKQIVADWQTRGEAIAAHFSFSDEQKTKADATLARYDAKLVEVLAAYETDIDTYRHEVGRSRDMANLPAAADVPYLQKRVAARQRNPVGEPGATIPTSAAEWRGEVLALENAFEHDLLSLRTKEQAELGAAPVPTTELATIDRVVTWVLIIAGGCLTIGLFTRLSALVLAGFLGSVIASQPPWIAGTVPVYFQVVEFVALLALATTLVGRWGGFDFFIHHLINWPFRAAKGS